MKLPIELQRLMLDMQVAQHERMVEAASADPVKHKLTLAWPTGSRLSWRYYDGGVDKRGVRRRFGWTTTRNAAGYFLSFVEVWDSKRGRGERKDFVASRTRHRMKERAERLWKAYRNR